MRTLLEAASCGDLTTVEKLLADGVSANGDGSAATTPAHAAARGGFDYVVEVLLAHGADPRAPDVRDNRAIHEACWEGHAQVVAALLRHGAGIESRGYLGRTPLHAACRSPARTSELVRYLVAAGADVEACDKADKTPLFRCCEAYEEFAGPDNAAEFIERARILLESGARGDVLDRHRMTALAHTSNLGMHELFRRFGIFE